MHPENRHTTGSLARAVEARLIGAAHVPIMRLGAIDEADSTTLTFVRAPRYAREFLNSAAAAAVFSQNVPVPDFDHEARAVLVVPDADLAMIAILKVFGPPTAPVRPGVHASAVVATSARLGHGVCIGPRCVIGEDSVIGDGTVLIAGVTIGNEAEVGPLCTLHANVVIQDRCIVGQGCLLHPGVVIGADGFGFRPGADGRGLVKIPHIGIVRIGSGVEIGANSCVDRAKFGETVVGDGTKIDNLVQIGHNCRIGRSCIICAGGMIGGSTVLGDGCVLGGSVAVSDNVELGPRTTISGASAVADSLPGHAAYGGIPAMPMAHWKRLMVTNRSMHKLRPLLRRLASHEMKAPEHEGE